MGNTTIGCCNSTHGQDVSFNYPQASVSETAPFTSLKAALVLILNVKSSTQLAKGTQLFVSPQGLIGRRRAASDGCTFFGCKRKQDGHIVNDVVVPSEDSSRGQHLVIYFERESYWLKDLASGAGVFLKIEGAQPLRSKMLLNFGESFVIVEVAGPVLTLYVYGEAQASQ